MSRRSWRYRNVKNHPARVTQTAFPLMPVRCSKHFSTISAVVVLWVLATKTCLGAACPGQSSEFPPVPITSLGFVFLMTFLLDCSVFLTKTSFFCFLLLFSSEALLFSYLLERSPIRPQNLFQLEYRCHHQTKS